MFVRALTISLLLFVMIISVPVLAQMNYNDKKSETVILDDENLEIAEDLRDILEQLEKLAHDYQQYFSEDNNRYASRYKRALLKMLINIDEGKYCTDVDFLLNDISDIKQELVERESKIKHDLDQKKFYRNVKSLRTQLELLEEFIHEDLVGRLKANSDGIPQIKAYLEQEKEYNNIYRKYVEDALLNNEQLWEELKMQAEEIKSLLNETYKIKLSDEDIIEIEQAVEEARKYIKFDDKSHPKQYVVPDVQDVTVIYSPDSVRTPTIITITPTNQKHTYISGNVLTNRSIVDSMVVASSEIPIFINNLTGDLEIKGHNSKKIIVNLAIQVMSDEIDKSDNFVKNVSIKLLSNEDGIYISPHFPQMKSIEQKIVNSEMTIYVPNKNRIICESSFGKLNLKGLKNGADIEAKHCNLLLTTVTGGAKILNSSGVTKLSNISGKIDIISSLGPVIIKNCDGEYEIENTYSPIEMYNCQGKASVKNSGNTIITDHFGKVRVDGNNGTIKVTDHRGDVTANNYYKPLILSNVDGNVSLSNENASITADEINGTLRAQNKFGSINLSALSGPVDLYSNSGSISMVVDEYYKGSSKIDSEYGKVNLFLDPNSDIFISALTEGGSITSAFNSQINKNNQGSSTKVTLGKGNSSLKISGTNSVIVIDDNQ